MSSDGAKDASPLTWTGDGQPRSRLYDDVYFSAEDGLAEARAVFLPGCGLPEAWAGTPRLHGRRVGVRARSQHPGPDRPVVARAPAGRPPAHLLRRSPPRH